METSRILANGESFILGLGKNPIGKVLEKILNFVYLNKFRMSACYASSTLFYLIFWRGDLVMDRVFASKSKVTVLTAPFSKRTKI